MPFLYRILHFSYARGTSFSELLNNRVTPAGWLICGLWLLTAVLGIDVARSFLYQVFAMVVALLSVAMLWAWGRRARLGAVRELPRYATVGEACPYSVVVRNDGRFKVRGFILSDRPP
ncbi:MAG: hypothetical protein GWO24_24830, partial [Akkermansiaceae bacterium]|nr:hypothetical protein [Akkermansiaceae bacterium]